MCFFLRGGNTLRFHTSIHVNATLTNHFLQVSSETTFKRILVTRKYRSIHASCNKGPLHIIQSSCFLTSEILQLPISGMFSVTYLVATVQFVRHVFFGRHVFQDALFWKDCVVPIVSRKGNDTMIPTNAVLTIVDLPASVVSKAFLDYGFFGEMIKPM